MNKTCRSVALLLSLFSLQMAPCAATSKPASSEYKIDSARSKVSFTVMRGKNVGARGCFTGITGSVVYNSKRPALSRVTAYIPLSSIDTGVAVRDNDLVGAKYFDSKRFPRATFKSKKISLLKGGKMAIEGVLDLHGFKKPVKLTMDRPPRIVSSQQKKATFTAEGSAKINQSDFGLSLLPLHPDGAVRINPAISINTSISATK
ncbi:MAG TPA: YceI family protein [Candidatus Melainabacteria bacterium]|nr:YceI family protein [Candidatus Melainabacteria bacterium]